MGVEVCPVHKAEFKKSVYFPYIHVGTMSQHSQPGGLKRKHPDDEDEDEDPLSAPNPNRRPPQTLTKQEMLNLTQCKLEKIRYTPNTNLCQYVVMLNTARNLEAELLRDGVRIWPSGTAFIPTVNHQVPFDPSRPPPPDDARTNLNNLEDVVTSVSFTASSYSMDTDARTSTTSVINTSVTPSDIFGGVNSSVTHSSEYDRYLLDLDGPSSGRATPFVRSDVESCALWNEDSDRLTSLNWSSVLNLSSVDVGNPIAASSFYSETTVESSTTSCNFDASSNSSSGCSSDCSISDDAMSSSETSLHTLMPVTTGIPTGMNSVGVNSTSSSSSPRVTSALGSSSSQSGSSPPNSEDEIFGDIDLALYDYDFTPLSPPNVRMAPVSAEELMQSLSSDQRVDNVEYLTSVRT